MARLRSTFVTGAKILFKTFEEAIHVVDWEGIDEDTGFAPIVKTEISDVNVVFTSFSERDVQYLSFGALIQPTEIKGIVMYEDIQSRKPTTLDILHDKTELDTLGVPTDLHIIGFQRDPMNVICILLLRGV